MKKMTEKTAPFSPAGTSPAQRPYASETSVSTPRLPRPHTASFPAHPLRKRSRTTASSPVSPANSPARPFCERLRDFDLPQIVTRRLQNADRPFWLAFAVVFLALNLIFLFHGTHFMFGDHDWKYLKHGISLGAGLFEGRFSQFVPVTLLSRGEILPIINNALGFAGFALGIALLARYWRLPHTKSAYVTFALSAAITPYILSFMYFAFLVIPVLGWNMFVIGALLVSEKEERFSLPRTAAAALLITLALGGYPPVINLIAVAFSVRLLFAALFEIPHPGAVPGTRSQSAAPIASHAQSTACIPSPAAAAPAHISSPDAIVPGAPLPLSLPLVLKTLCHRYLWTIFNLALGITCYKLCLWALTRTGAVNAAYYNLQTTPFAEWGEKFLLVSKDVWLQFSATLPFIPAAYKTAAGIVVLAGTAAALLRIFTPFRRPGASAAFPAKTSAASAINAPAAASSPSVRSAASETLSTTFSAPVRLFVLLLLAAVFYAPLVTLFISTSLAETEFSPRIDFFGLMYLYAAMFALSLKNAAPVATSAAALNAAPNANTPTPAAAASAASVSAPGAITRPIPCAAVFCKNFAILGAAAAAAIAVNCLFEAQKVWKLGFDAEMKLYRRAAARFIASPDFSPGRRYIMVQGGSPAFRPRFYHTPYSRASDDLLGISYVPGMNPSVMWNYYGVAEYADSAAYVYTFRPDVAAAAAIANARPWPASQSTLVLPAVPPAGQSIILLILSPEGLSGLKNTYGI